MSFRRNAIIAILIVAVCMLLVTQLIGNPAPQTPPSGLTVRSSTAGPDSASIETDQLIELRAVVHMSTDRFQAISKLNEQFRSEFPSISVELTNIASGQAYSYIKEHAIVGSSPDILQLDHVWVNEFAASGFLSHQLEQYVQLKEDNADRLVEWNGYEWAVPFEADPYVVVIHQPSQPHAEKEPLPRTQEGWFAFREALSADGTRSGMIYIDPEDPYALISLLWALGGEWDRNADGMYQLSGNSQPLIDLLFGSLSGEDKNGPLYPLLVLTQLSPDEKWKRFEAGEFPIMVVRESELRAMDNGKYRSTVSLVDGSGDEQEGLWLSGTSLAVSSVSEYPAEAYKWIEYMLRASGQQTGRRSGRSFDADPEIRAKMEVVRDVMQRLFDGTVSSSEMNNRLSERWSARK